MAKPTVLVVTGANRGIGLAICHQALKQITPLKLYACSRAGKDLGLTPQNRTDQITYPTLDITKPDQINQLVAEIKSTDGHVDILINNAGITQHGDDPAQAKTIVTTNYTGTLSMCQAFLPLLQTRPGGRIVNISSIASQLQSYSPTLASQFRNPDATLADLSALQSQYLSALSSSSSSIRDSGFPDSKGYCVSKALINALTHILARDNPDLTINCCCPGWIDTDMGRYVGTPSKTPDEGARIPFKLARGDLGGVSGRYWANESIRGTGDGRVMAW